jgi:hypothetical protein
LQFDGKGEKSKDTVTSPVYLKEVQKFKKSVVDATECLKGQMIFERQRRTRGTRHFILEFLARNTVF